MQLTFWVSLVISSTVGMGSSSFAIMEDDKQNEYIEGETVKVRGKNENDGDVINQTGDLNGRYG